MTLARYALLAALALLPAASVPASAQDTMRIAAVVNDEVISVMDLEARLRLVLISSNVGDTPENRARASPQILRQLIDERLQLQEAKRLNVDASENEMKEALRRIEEQSNLPAGRLEDELRQAGIAPSTFLQQLRSNIVWQKVIRQRMAPQVQVGDDEVEEILASIRRSKDLPELRIVEILLGIDKPDREGEVRRLAEQLVEQARGGADFNALARQFSESASAAVGGEIGWVLPNQLDEAIQREVTAAAPGTIIGPIRTVAGYQIIRLVERRLMESQGPDEAIVNLRQAQFSLAGAAEDEVRKLASPLADAKSCPDFEKLAEEAKASPPYVLGRLKIGDLNATLKPAVTPLGAGKVSQPIKVGNAIVVLMVCDRTEPPSTIPNAEVVRDQIFRSKLLIVGRRYLRDLRRAAYLDFRT